MCVGGVLEEGVGGEGLGLILVVKKKTLTRLVTLLNTHFNTLFHLHIYQKHPKYLTQI